MHKATEALERLRAIANPQDAAFLQRYFKTGPGQYGEGDRFLGIRVPAVRRIVPSCDALPLAEIDSLLASEWHEARLLALLVLVRRFGRGDEAVRAEIYQLYLARTARINNWDLVDTSAPHIVGAYLAERSRRPLQKLAHSKSLWERRIAIMSTFHFIRSGEVEQTLALADVLLEDREDLIHKAVGWMLREAWSRAPGKVGPFVAARCARMPRTMLRYAIEKQPKEARRQFLAGAPPLTRRA